MAITLYFFSILIFLYILAAFSKPPYRKRSFTVHSRSGAKYTDIEKEQIADLLEKDDNSDVSSDTSSEVEVELGMDETIMKAFIKILDEPVSP